MTDFCMSNLRRSILTMTRRLRLGMFCPDWTRTQFQTQDIQEGLNKDKEDSEMITNKILQILVYRL